MRPERLSARARAVLEDPGNTLAFSIASLWEIVIKTMLERHDDFAVDAVRLRSKLLESGYEELPVTGDHALAVTALPSLHKDPFDRLLLAQAMTEGLTLLTADHALGAYPGPILRV
ncbi:MAG: type II toxin-antitoxin system VapC family toxin [Brevundimonas sp.]|nr:type II toxin-antitoxin system VapC family toxin [Brevundimonas sp.]